MVKPFTFTKLPLIHFGIGKAGLLPRLIGNYGSSVMLVTGHRSFIQSLQAENLLDALQSNGITVAQVTVQGEPSPEQVDQVVQHYGDRIIDVVVSIGGGSAIDTGKAVAAMMYKTGSVKEYLEGVGTRNHPGTRIPFIAVPTTAGTGSEATRNAVLSQVGSNGFKRSLRHDNLVPDIAVIDPALTLSCQPAITAAAGMDCFTQLTEAYLSDKSNDLTDAMALEGLKALRRSLLRSFSHGDDMDARTGMAFAALTSGIGLANAGLGAVHGIAAALGGSCNIPHGVICGTLMAAANEINIRELRKVGIDQPALKKYAQLGRIFCDKTNRSDDYFIDGFIEYLYELTDQLQLEKLGSYGVTEQNIQSVCSVTDIKNNPVRLSADNLAEIMLKRF